MTFEKQLEELETVVGRLEDGDVPLEEALALFEKGIGLVRELAGNLDRVEERLQILVREASDALRLEEVEDLDDD